MPHKKQSAQDNTLSIERTKSKIVDAMYDLGASNKFRPITFHLNPMKNRCENLAVTDSTPFEVEHRYWSPFDELAFRSKAK